VRAAQHISQHDASTEFGSLSNGWRTELMLLVDCMSRNATNDVVRSRTSIKFKLLCRNQVSCLIEIKARHAVADTAIAIGNGLLHSCRSTKTFVNHTYSTPYCLESAPHSSKIVRQSRVH
jgi:hypothetical protein